MTEEIVKYLTSCFDKKGDGKEFTERKYLEIFQLLCISGSIVNINNQKLILEHFLKKLQESFSIFEIRLVEEEAGIIVVASLDKVKQERLPFH